MKTINLNRYTAVELAGVLNDLFKMEENADYQHKVARVEIKAGDPSGKPEGWDEVEVTPIFETKVVGGNGED